MSELGSESSNANYIHKGGAVAVNGSGIEFQSNTPNFIETSGLTEICSVDRGTSRSVCPPWNGHRSGHLSNDGVGCAVQSRPMEVEGRHCRLEGVGETHCGSFRLRTPWAEIWVCSELIAPSGVASSGPTHVLFCETGGRQGKDSGDIGDECKEGKGETNDADPVGMVRSDERPNIKGEEAREDERTGHSGSE